MASMAVETPATEVGKVALERIKNRWIFHSKAWGSASQECVYHLEGLRYTEVKINKAIFGPWSQDGFFSEPGW